MLESRKELERHRREIGELRHVQVTMISKIFSVMETRREYVGRCQRHTGKPEINDAGEEEEKT
ncbi:Protein CBG25178 [Caenorhabditis briggsae]|uniref:Protein CBG25178 n=1 Tax=Caenorhabditis briggsae TaxID=6238 RepID=B6IFZ8_CAEBR|nr:Protein CBG25178 [Caenorhabditis briggsae]CAR98828.1 Protein CBG25178 [Caenorhabditis briggsae]